MARAKEARTVDAWYRTDGVTPKPRCGQGSQWQAIWYVGPDPNKDRRKKSFTFRGQADAYVAKINKAQADGTFASVAVGQQLLRDYGQKWMADKRNRASTMAHIEGKWRLHIEPLLGPYRLDDLNRDIVQAAVNVWDAQMAPSTVRVIFAYLRSILLRAVEDGLPPVTYLSKVNLTAVENPVVIPLTPEQVSQIAENVAPRYRAMVLLAAGTGMRAGELRGLTADRLTFKPDGTVSILLDRQLAGNGSTFGPLKSKRRGKPLVHTISGDPDLAAVLREHMALYPRGPHGLIFTGRSAQPGTLTRKPITRGTMSDIWHRATDGVTAEGRQGWHTLRHFHASDLLSQGISVGAVADRLGDTEAEIQQTYSHITRDDQTKILAATSATFKAITRPRLALVR